ncbi:NAD-binding protein [Oscillatoria sp. CS-180]|uniref:potassium channel family protein n=1 Tax=Oscillatoria sp. CS-180 TaxID=3021720 RepID=UPI00232B1C11|nr:NAD-binding protein [Oscillatoria sp. CS-180]MDB9528909.1 NAD-binding protein [Oscillatoria sp. CS-180]
MRPKQTIALSNRDQILVCGLGSLGQHCVANLQTFGVRVNAIDLTHPDRWEIAHLPKAINNLVIGDCRQSDILEQAGVRRCRAALLVTENERVNLEAALSARVLNPDIRLVVRSEKQNLNNLLEQQLTNFIAFEPTQLAAPAFALEALDEAMTGFFKVDNQSFRVVTRTIQPQDSWCDTRKVYEVINRDRRVLRYLKAETARLKPEEMALRSDHPASASAQFYTWLPDSIIRAGDVVVSVEAESADDGSVIDYARNTRRGMLQRVRQGLRNWRDWRPREALRTFWRYSYNNQIRRVALLCGITVVSLCLIGSVLMVMTGTAPSFPDAFYATVVLLLGGYGDVFGGVELTEPVVWWLRLFSLTLTLAGTAFIGVLYALLTEKLLTSRFEFLTKRPPVPEAGHVVVIWLGRVGRQVVEILQDLKQPVVGITSQSIEPDILPHMPLVTGPIRDILDKTNLATAKSIVAVSDDEIQNLELGLMAYRSNPKSRLIIRTYDQIFTDKVAHLFPYAQVLCASALSAEAFAGAAFGENVMGLFRLYHQTVLVTQYAIKADDTLQGLLLAEVAYGYGVVPIWHQQKGQRSRVMPSDDIQLHEGDRLVVLSTIRGLRRIEQGDTAPKQWQVELLQANAADAIFEGGTEIARVTGCAIGEAHDLMNQLPAIFPHKLYLHQAIRLVRRLGRLRVAAKILPLEDRVGRNL